MRGVSANDNTNFDEARLAFYEQQAAYVKQQIDSLSDAIAADKEMLEPVLRTQARRQLKRLKADRALYLEQIYTLRGAH